MSTFSDTFIAANAGNLPVESLPMLRERLATLNEQQIAYVLSTELKSPIVALVLSFFLGYLGIDRFYLGQIGLGFAKLFFSWITFGIWPLVDLFLIMNATKRVNLEKLNQALALAGASFSR